MEVGGRTAWAIARDIARFGDMVEVVDPPEVRQILTDLGRSLVSQYQ